MKTANIIILCLSACLLSACVKKSEEYIKIVNKSERNIVFQANNENYFINHKLAYLPVIGIPSVFSAKNSKMMSLGGKHYSSHRLKSYEMNASKRAKEYFEKHYNVKWKESEYPTHYPQTKSSNHKY